MMILNLDPVVYGSLIEACVEIGDTKFQSILNRGRNSAVEIDLAEMPVVINYLNNIEDHLAEKFPHYDDEDPLYSEHDEDGYFDGLETYRHPLVYQLADELGDDFIDKYSQS